MKNNKKAFTLAELLIVVAIIGVLVAIAIPVFSDQLETSKEATDIANVRAAYAEAMSTFLATNKEATAAAVAVQTKADWQGTPGYVNTRVGGSEKQVTYAALTAKDSYLVTVKTDGAVTITKK